MGSSRSKLVFFTLFLIIAIPIALRYFDNIFNYKHNGGIELITVNILLALIINTACGGKEFLVMFYNFMLILNFLSIVLCLIIFPEIIYLNTHPWLLFNPKSQEFQSRGLAVAFMTAFPGLLYLTYLIRGTLKEFGVGFENNMIFVEKEEENGQEIMEMI